jgi:hypothetical protein
MRVQAREQNSYSEHLAPDHARQAKADLYGGTLKDLEALFLDPRQLDRARIESADAANEWRMLPASIHGIKARVTWVEVQEARSVREVIVGRRANRRYTFGEVDFGVMIEISPSTRVTALRERHRAEFSFWDASGSAPPTEERDLEIAGADGAVLLIEHPDTPEKKTFRLLFAAGQMRAMLSTPVGELSYNAETGVMKINRPDGRFADPRRVLQGVAQAILANLAEGPYAQEKIDVPSIFGLIPHLDALDGMGPADAKSSATDAADTAEHYRNDPFAREPVLTSPRAEWRSGWKTAAGSTRLGVTLYGSSHPEETLKQRTAKPIRGTAWRPAALGDAGRICHRVGRAEDRVYSSETHVVVRQGAIIIRAVAENNANDASGNVSPDHSRRLAVKLTKRVLASLNGENPRPAGQKNPAPARWGLKLNASAPGYEPAGTSRAFATPPAHLVVTGTVRSDRNEPLPGATVVLSELGDETVSDEAGRYSFALSFMDGVGRARLTEVDFALEAIPGALKASLQWDEPPIANGKRYRAVLRVTNEGEPHAGQKVSVGMVPAWGRGGRVAAFLEPSPEAGSLVRYVTTDEDGRVMLDGVPAPVVVPDRMPQEIAGGQLDRVFPLYGVIRVRDATGARCEATYPVRSPYPRIRHFGMPAVFSGDWTECRLEVEDPDSQRCRAHLQVRGVFRLPGGATLPDELLTSFDLPRLTFGYRPPDGLGDDIRNQKELWKELLKTNASYLLKLGLEHTGQSIVEEAALLQQAAPAAARSRDLGGTVSTGAELYTAGKDGINNYMAADGAAADLAEWGRARGPGSETTDVLNLGNHIIGLAGLTGETQNALIRHAPRGALLEETVAPLLKTRVNLPLEALKLTYENAKTFHAVFKDLAAVANGWEDALPARVRVTLTDPDGHRLTEMRTVIVRFHRKGD